MTIWFKGNKTKIKRAKISVEIYPKDWKTVLIVSETNEKCQPLHQTLNIRWGTKTDNSKLCLKLHFNDNSLIQFYLFENLNLTVTIILSETKLQPFFTIPTHPSQKIILLI